MLFYLKKGFTLAFAGLVSEAVMGDCCAVTAIDDDDDGDDDCDPESEALDRYAPSQAGRTVSGLQHTHTHFRPPRPPTSSNTDTTHDGDDDWHRNRALFNVVWSEQDDSQTTARQPAPRHTTSSSKSAQSMRSTQSLKGGSDNYV